jgi:manganese-dependent inorganic pyrophosphatase
MIIQKLEGPMNEIIYVTGHKNPDTDSICSAIAYAEFKNKTGQITAIPIRLGEVNRETAFILNYFNVESPKYMDTVKTQVSDLNIDKVATISSDITIKMAWSIMKQNNIKMLPVVDENEKLIGIASQSNITSSYMDIWDSNIIGKSKTKLDNILDTLSARCLYKSSENPIFMGKIVVAAMTPESSENIIEEGDVVICGDREDSQHSILDSHSSLMVITGDHSVSEEILNKAKKEKCTLISTPYDSFTATRLISQSIPVSYVMVKENLISFSEDDFIEDIRDVMLQTRYRSYPVVNKNGNVIGGISRYHLISQNRKKVILVDHNEKTQSVNGIEDADVLEILDHHRIADVQTGQPIYFRNEPVGSTSTIVALRYFENGIKPSKKTAGILAAAIISDTLLFKSPTSTVIDQMMMQRLADISSLDVEKFSKEMFKAGTSLQGKTVEEIFHQDFKTFNFNNISIGVSQVGTMDLEGFLPMQEEMIDLMEKKSEENNFNLILLMLTDIIKSGSLMLVVGHDKEIFQKAFNVKLENNAVYLPNILSRKKQIIPPITNAINNIRRM